MNRDHIVCEDAVSAWFQAIAQHGWRAASLRHAAALSGLSAQDIQRFAADKLDALSIFQGKVAKDSARAAAGEGAGMGSVRDRLFDGLMQGFDVLQSERAAVLALWTSRDPAVFAIAIGRAGSGVRRLASAAGCDTKGVRGQVRLAALAALCAKAFDTWRSDISPDMQATMAEIDRMLAKAEQAETEGFSLALVGLSGLPNPFDRARRSSPGPRSE